MWQVVDSSPVLRHCWHEGTSREHLSLRRRQQLHARAASAALGLPSSPGLPSLWLSSGPSIGRVSVSVCDKMGAGRSARRAGVSKVEALLRASLHFSGDERARCEQGRKHGTTRAVVPVESGRGLCFVLRPLAALRSSFPEFPSPAPSQDSGPVATADGEKPDGESGCDPVMTKPRISSARSPFDWSTPGFPALSLFTALFLERAQGSQG